MVSAVFHLVDAASGRGGGDPRDAPRDRALTQLLNLVHRGMTEVDGYAAHAQGIKNATVQAYAAEMVKQQKSQAATGGHATTTPMDLS